MTLEQDSQPRGAQRPMRSMFPTGPGSDAINNNCLACHSADHVLNQPSLSTEAWREVVNKMITAYKAPISPEDAKAIVDYLAHTKGKDAS